MPEDNRIYYEYPDDYCSHVVAVLGDDNVYPCKLIAGHDGQCEADYQQPCANPEGSCRS